jgi:hypothetical protein
MGDKVKVSARVKLPKDSDDTLVQRELLVGAMYIGGTDAHRGDVVELTEAQAQRHDALGNTAEVGTLERLAEERRKADEEAAERAEEQQQLDDEEAHRRIRHAENRLNDNVDDDGDVVKGEKADSSSDDDAKTSPSVASNDGPRTTRRTRG